MPSQNFEIKVNDKLFLVSYDTEGSLQNLLKSIIYDGLPLDIRTLIQYDAATYGAIRNAILKHSKEYWEAPRLRPTYESTHQSFFHHFK